MNMNPPPKKKIDADHKKKIYWSLNVLPSAVQKTHAV